MTEGPTHNSMLKVLNGEAVTPPPIWMMRQAGRYLPEYRAVREKVPTFLELVFNPELAAEVTLQPIRRFGFDAAILFSDILVIPYALGCQVTFEAGEGPRLSPISNDADVMLLPRDVDQTRLAPVYETIRRVKAELKSETALLGFCGAPWTVATYMVAGRGGDDQIGARLFAYKDSIGFGKLIDLLVDGSAAYLIGQFEAGVDAVQVFDTWAGVLTPEEFHRWCIEPTRRIVAQVRHKVPNAKIIGFPRGAGTSILRYATQVPVDAVGLDWMIDKKFARDFVQDRLAIQGNLDPIVLLAGGQALDRAVDDVLTSFGGKPFIFNLGHGILPDTPIAHVERMIARVRGVRAAS